MHSRIVKQGAAVVASVLVATPMALDAGSAAAATIRSNRRVNWNIGAGTCTTKNGNTVENNVYWPNLSTNDGQGNWGANRWWLGNFPHGSYHFSDADIPTGAPNTHIYKSFPSGVTYNCRWADFVSHADGTNTNYHCLVVSGTYNGMVARPIWPAPQAPQNYNGSVDSYFCVA